MRVPRIGPDRAPEFGRLSFCYFDGILKPSLLSYPRWDRLIWSEIGNTTNLAARLQSLSRGLVLPCRTMRDSATAVSRLHPMLLETQIPIADLLAPRRGRKIEVSMDKLLRGASARPGDGRAPQSQPLRTNRNNRCIFVRSFISGR